MNNNFYSFFGLVIFICFLSGVAFAQTAYVTDRLQLSVHEAANTSGKPFAKLKSGDQVQVLEENRYYAKVKLADGRRGWVKKAYLVSDKPAVLVVDLVTNERDQAVNELQALRTGLSKREAEISRVEAEVQAREELAAAEVEELATLRQQNVELNSKLEAYGFSVPGNLFLVAVFVSLIAGCLVAWWVFDYRSRLRHGGFRIR